MRSLPPPRFIVKEEGRRLVTIDTATGERVGLAAVPSSDGVHAAAVQRIDRELTATRQKGPADGANRQAGPADGAKRRDPERSLPNGQKEAAPQRQSALVTPAPPPDNNQQRQPPDSPRTAGQSRTSAASSRTVASDDPGRAGRIIGVAVVAVFVAMFLIISYMWVFVAIMLAIPPVRSWLLTTMKSAIASYIDPPRR